MMDRGVRRALKITAFAVLFFIVLAGLGFVVKGLWNWLTPELFGWKTIGYWQAVGLTVLCKLLFGGFSGGRGGGNWRRRMGDRWDRMTPDEREKFGQAWRERWGGSGPAEPKPSV